MRVGKRIQKLEALLRPQASDSRFVNAVVVVIQNSREELAERLIKIADCWQQEPKSFAPWQELPEVEKLVTAMTPEERAEANHIRQDIQLRFAAAEQQPGGQAWIEEWQMPVPWRQAHSFDSSAKFH